MDETLRQLIMREDEARCSLDYAIESYEVKRAIEQLNKAMAVTSAYLEFKKREHEYECISTHECNV
jgi:hypothetical protein